MSSPEAPIGAAPPAADAGGVDDEDRLVRVDLVGHHIAQARFGMPANLLAAGLLLWTLWPMAHHGRLVAWYVAVGLSQVAYAANNRLVRRDLTAGRLHLTTLILPVVCSSSTTTRPPGRCPPRCASGTGSPWWPSAASGTRGMTCSPAS